MASYNVNNVNLDPSEFEINNNIKLIINSNKNKKIQDLPNLLKQYIQQHRPVNEYTLDYIEEYFQSILPNSNEKNRFINDLMKQLREINTIGFVLPDIPNTNIFPNVPTYPIAPSRPINKSIVLLEQSFKNIKTKKDFQRLNQQLYELFIKQMGLTPRQKELFSSLIKKLFWNKILSPQDIKNLNEVYSLQSTEKSPLLFGGSKNNYTVVKIDNQKCKIGNYNCNKPSQAISKFMKRKDFNPKIKSINIMNIQTKKIYGPYSLSKYI